MWFDAGGWLDDGADCEVEFLGEFKIAGVVCWDGHDCAGAVAHHHIVGDPDWNSFIVDWIDGVTTGEDTGLFLLQLRSL